MKLTMTMFQTVDGVYQAPGGPDEDRSGGFEHGGWLAPYFSDEMVPVINESFARADAFLLGRRTYDIFAAYWPRQTDPNDAIAGPLNRLPKYVVSRTLRSPEWKGSSVVTIDEVAALKERPGRELQVHGSGALVQSLIERDLIDEYRLWTFPVMLGTGKRLFGEGTLPRALELVDTKKTDKGVVLHCYRRLGKPTYGTVGE